MKGIKFQSHLQLIFFFWRHAVDSASISAIGISLLSQVSLILTRVTLKPVISTVFMHSYSYRSVPTIIVVNLSLK